MSFLFVGGGVALLAFGLVYIRPGRFGMTILALGAGYMLATLWTDALTIHAQDAGVQLPPLSLTSMLYGGLVLLPGVLVLLFGQKRQGLMPRLVASLVAAIFVLALLLPLFIAKPQAQTIYETIDRYREIIITAGLVFGLLDALFSRHPKPLKHSKH